MRFCGVCGAQLRRPPAPVMLEAEAEHAEHRQMTVIFCDVVDSTSLAERLDSEDFRDVLSSYHGACARAIEHFGGYVAQYQGDGVIAYFGYPRAHEDDARRAVLASLELLDEVASLNERLRDLLDVSLQVRVGLHSGLVVVGEMGTGAAREEHAAVGETLHIAARVQTVATPDTVVLTDTTLELIGDQFETHPLGARTLKGISQAIGIHHLARGSDASLWLERASATGDVPLVDRLDELAKLTGAWDAARRGDGVIAHASGEAGIGKSRLVRALREQVRGQGGGELLLQCSPHHTSTELYPATRYLERRADLNRTQPPELQIAALERCARDAGLDPSEAVPLLAELLSIPGRAPAHELTPFEARNATLKVLKTLLVGGAASHPLLFVVEDLHWADPTTIELLERIVADAEHARIACLFTFRREYQPPWKQWQEVVDVELGPLTTADVRAIAAAVSRKQLDDEELRRVESATEGVPMFVEEMVKALAADRPMHPSPESRVPPTLRGLLAERLDRLPDLRGVIDVAAILGREFERRLIEALSPLDSRSFSSAVAQLAAEEVLRPVEGSHTRLEFKHVLLQEVAYERLLRRRRRALHARVAELLVAAGPPAWEADAERIAHHWSCAGYPAKALAYWELAGRRALKRAAFVEAAEHYRRGVESLDAARPEPDGDTERGELLTHLGAALQAGRSPAADVDAIYARARTTCERTGSREQLLPVLRGQCMFHVVRGEYPQAFTLAQEMRQTGSEDERPGWVAEGHYYLGLAQMMTGALEHARLSFEQATRLYRPQERGGIIPEAHSDPGVGSLAYLSSLLWNQGRAREAVAASDQSLELAEQVGGSVTLAQAWGMRCGLLLVRGEMNEFISWLEKARVHSVEQNVGYWSTVCSIWSAWVEGHAGSPHAATARVRRHLDTYLDSGARIGSAHFHTLLADLYLLTGDKETALVELRRGQEHIDAAGELYYEPDLQWYLARALMEGESPDAVGATAAYERAIGAARAQGAQLLELRAAIGLALHQRRIGETCSAWALMESLSSTFASDSEIPDVVHARALQDRQTAPH
jgi:class 3 adenylate cyclase/tetratricopeptide (TPR) repeat protein